MEYKQLWDYMEIPENIGLYPYGSLSQERHNHIFGVCTLHIPNSDSEMI